MKHRSLFTRGALVAMMALTGAAGCGAAVEVGELQPLPLQAVRRFPQ